MAKKLNVEVVASAVSDNVRKRAYASLFGMFYNYTQVVEGLENTNKFDFVSTFIDFSKDFMKFLNIEDKKTYLDGKKETLLSFTREIEEMHRTNTVQSMQLILLRNYMDKINYFKYSSPLNLNYERMLLDFSSFLDHFCTSESNNIIIATKALSMFPVRMTNDKFIEYVKSCLQSLDIDEPEEIGDLSFDKAVGELTETIRPLSSNYFFKYFKDNADEIASINEYAFNIDFEKISEEDFDKVIERINACQQSLNSAKEISDIIYEAMHFAMLVSLNLDDVSEFIKDNEFILKWATDLTELEGKDFNAKYLGEIDAAFDKILALELSSRNVYKDLFPKNAKVNVSSDIFNDEEKTALIQIFETDRINSKLFTADLTNVTLTNNDSSTYEEKTEKFLALVVNILKSVSPKERRFLKQWMIGIIPSCLNNEELFAYVDEAIFSEKNETEKQFTAINISNWIFPSNNENDDNEIVE